MGLLIVHCCPVRQFFEWAKKWQSAPKSDVANNLAVKQDTGRVIV
jgi:hypothetical protein